jgi:hypothetical protein
MLAAHSIGSNSNARWQRGKVGCGSITLQPNILARKSPPEGDAMDAAAKPLDVAIVGAGLCGVICLHYARLAGLDARVFEKEDAIGGLWRQLPPWQDIQISPADWALGDLPVHGAHQPHILANIQAWVDKYALADGISLDTPVLSAREANGLWTLTTPSGAVQARNLIAATGAHNKPIVPSVRREASRVRELHSSELRDPAQLAGQDVLVVGGGASAFDLLDLCFAQGARRVAWVHRGLKWFVPTRKPKHISGNVHGFARMQASGMTAAQQSAALNTDMRQRYEKFGLGDIVPDHAFDVLHHQLIPGRHRMLENFAAIERHRGTIEAIEGRTVTISGGQRVDTDLLLWGTGYSVDLSYFESPQIAAIDSLQTLGDHCGGVFRSLDAPNLFFPSVGLDGIGAAPWAYALGCRTIAAHIAGRAKLDLEPVGHRINHMALVDYLAARDPFNYPPDSWREEYRQLALNTPDEQPYPVP